MPEKLYANFCSLMTNWMCSEVVYPQIEIEDLLLNTTAMKGQTPG
jgi:hypothetical protein